MSIFTDSNGRRWLVELDATALSRIRRSAGLDLRAAIDFDALLPVDDPDRCAGLLWEIVSPLARPAGVSKDDFTAAVTDPSVLTEAREAVADALLLPPENGPPEPSSRSPFRTA